MYTIEDYLDQLVLDKASLVSNLEAKGVTASSEETFTTLVPKVLDITNVNNETTSINITSNGTQTITPSSGYTGIGSLTINTSVTPNLQSKSVTISSNTTTSISADTGYEGLSSVSVTTNVPTEVTEYFNTEIKAGDSAIGGWKYLIKKFPTLTGIDSTTGTNGDYMFYNLPPEVTDLTFMNGLDTSSLTTMQSFFAFYKGTIIPLINSSNATNMNNFCRGCSNITTAPLFNTGNNESFNAFFRDCSKLKTAPALNTSKGHNFGSMFSNCPLLEDVPQYDMTLTASGSSNMNGMFGSCPSLTDTSINNIMASVITATRYTGTKTLAHLGFNASKYPASRIQALSNYTAFTTAGWSIGYN